MPSQALWPSATPPSSASSGDPSLRTTLRSSNGSHGPSTRTSPLRTMRRRPSAPTPTTGTTSRRSASATASSHCRPRHRRSPYLKALETRASQSPEGLRAGTTGLALPTLRRRLAAIASRHATASLETPTNHPLVRRLLRRYSRSRGTAEKKKEPLLIEHFPAILAAMGDDLAAQRDRALLLLGYAGAFRRSELVALDVEHLKFSKRGLYVWIAAAKNDPRKKGRELYVPRLPAGSSSANLCAAAALERWLDVIGNGGPIFRTFDLRGLLTAQRLDPGDVARIVRRRAAAAGVAGDFAGHSLRRGFITNAAKKKTPIENIKRVTGQRSNAVVLDYVAAATLDYEPPLLEIVSGS